MKNGKLVYAVLSAIVMAIGLDSCTYTPVDPIVPVITNIDTNIKANQVTFTVDVPNTDLVVMQRKSVLLDAQVVMHKDTTSADSAVRNYVLKDSSILWSIVSGNGTISAAGMYTAPSVMTGTSETVIVSARPNVDPRLATTIHITVRKPNYQPVAYSTYWVRDHYPIDSLTGMRDESKKYSDSTVVQSTASVGGRQATVLVCYRNGLAVDSSYVINSNNTVYQYLPLNDKLSITALQSQWIKVIDPNEQTWIAYDTSFTNQSTSFNGQAAVLNGSIRIVNNLESADSITLNGNTYDVQKVTSVCTVNLILTVNGITVPLQYTRRSTQWVSDNYGTVRSIDEMVQALNQSCNCCIRTQTESVARSSSLR